MACTTDCFVGKGWSKHFECGVEFWVLAWKSQRLLGRMRAHC